MRLAHGTAAVTFAVFVTVLTNMPVFLAGALATEIAAKIHAPIYGIGTAIGVYWTAAALASACTSPINRILTEKQMGVAALVLAVCSLAGSACWIPSWPWLIFWAGAGGIGNGLGHPSSNHQLSINVPSPWHGLAFGLKQAAVPLAGLAAGASIPLVALPLGWRFAFALMALLGVLVLIPATLVRAVSSMAATHRPIRRMDPHCRRLLVLMAVMTMFAAGSASSAVAFSVTGALERGIGTGLAGMLLALGSASGAATRVMAGWVVDKGGLLPLPIIRMAIIACAGGLILMAMPSDWSYLAGILLASGIGWGWPGLVHLFVSQVAPHATAGATGIVQTGSYIGSAVGPVLAGLIFSFGNPTTAWVMLATGAAIAAAISIPLGRRAKRLGMTV
ncbi:MFS transporter [Arthrobacter mobilis]|uniref:MFS transporter n=1 Tax=Arthrobacter mobilis TaxID=2724944 RepID=A0A7X6HEC9_9MICC|nr:MFS transporter [Arthrobacter mobilis]NKX55573.1 MFS transporter [Arthrobacter mobilis]